MSLLSFDDRNYDFSSIYNFRDFGGYAGLDGRRVKSGRLFRSAHLAALTQEDLDDIAKLNINLVVDLRHAPERKRQPSRLPEPTPQVAEYSDPPEAAAAKTAPHEAFMQHELHTAQDAHDYMMRSYTARPHDRGFQAIFADTLRFMASGEASTAPGILVHCAAGKDRTGTLCALVQAALGVSRADILHDYMMTLDAVDIEKIIGPAAAMFTKRYGRPIDAEALWPMFGVKPEYLEAALDGMLDANGGVETYLRDQLGLSQETILRLHEAYLV